MKKIGLLFITLDVLGLSDIPFLRFGNAVIVLWGINNTLRSRLIEGRTGYFDPFKQPFLPRPMASSLVWLGWSLSFHPKGGEMEGSVFLCLREQIL